MAINMVAGSKGERATVVGVSYATGVIIALIDKKKSNWTTPITAVTTVVGLGMALAGKGMVATIGVGLGAGGAALLGAATPSWFGAGTARRVATPVQMHRVGVDVRQSQNGIIPIN